jgi:hypothetical protein
MTAAPRTIAELNARAAASVVPAPTLEQRRAAAIADVIGR